MKIDPNFVSPCGLYCGVCAIQIANRYNNQELKKRLLTLYQGSMSGKGTLANSDNMTIEDIRCKGCLSGDRFMHCQQCGIRNCVKERG